jgi:hypothetical protein
MARACRRKLSARFHETSPFRIRPPHTTLPASPASLASFGCLQPLSWASIAPLSQCQTCTPAADTTFLRTWLFAFTISGAKPENPDEPCVSMQQVTSGRRCLSCISPVQILPKTGGLSLRPARIIRGCSPSANACLQEQPHTKCQIPSPNVSRHRPCKRAALAQDGKWHLPT